MSLLFTVLVVLLIGAVAVVASGRGAAMAEEYDDRPDVRVQADRPLSGADLRAVRFTTAVRGYRASEVDALLVRLARELDEARAGEPDRPETPGSRPSADGPSREPFESPPPAG